MPHVHTQKQGVKNNMANVTFTMFAINLLLSIYIFATYLQGANLCKSIFSPHVSVRLNGVTPRAEATFSLCEVAREK